ncbi:zinc-ribbon domain-containing protein [Raoultibacter massiliensis]|uniref:zinc ribbon domain-containing protein n=1 Tax=Raoultibacter massiliensis TaxID=1852371 RepID=UPI003A92CCC4
MCFRPPTIEAGPVKCPQCGAEVDPTANECPSCGAKAAPAPGIPPHAGCPRRSGCPESTRRSRRAKRPESTRRAFGAEASDARSVNRGDRSRRLRKPSADDGSSQSGHLQERPQQPLHSEEKQDGKKRYRHPHSERIGLR